MLIYSCVVFEFQVCIKIEVHVPCRTCDLSRVIIIRHPRMIRPLHEARPGCSKRERWSDVATNTM